jgi:hypothetical protein
MAKKKDENELAKSVIDDIIEETESKDFDKQTEKKREKISREEPEPKSQKAA